MGKPPLIIGIDEPFPADLRGGAVSIGNFDGVHLGHAALVQVLRKHADEVEGPAVVVTFDPHPLRLLAPDRFMPQLTTVADRVELLCRAGTDHVVVLKTTFELLSMEPLVFLQRLLADQLGVKGIVEGFNFRFGRDRGGDTGLLKQWCSERIIQTTILPAVLAKDGEPYSSSRVRAALNTGNLETVRNLLGRNYSIVGMVKHGEHRGKSLGFPTANLTHIPVHIPRDGVYAAKVVIADREHAAAVNIGANPTFDVHYRKVEVHVNDFDGDLYDSSIHVEFVERIRDTHRFNSKEELIAQLKTDVADAIRLALGKQPMTSLPHNNDLKAAIQRHLDNEVGPAFNIDGGTLEVLEIEDGTVRVRFHVVCLSCPSTIMTLIMGLEQELRKKFPEIEYLEAVP